MAWTSTTRSLRAHQQIGFVEKFAYAEDRTMVLKELVPGTEEHSFYHALHYQITGQEALLKTLLAEWAARTSSSPLRDRIERRWKLSQFEKDPKAVAEWLIRELGPDLSHQPQRPDEKRPDLQSALDPATVADEVFLRLALEDANQLKITDPVALHRLVVRKTPLSDPQRRQLLEKLQNPALPGLVELINTDLGREDSRGFGEFKIHAQLTVAQLEALLKLRPGLNTNDGFVRTLLGKMQPGPDVSLEADPAAREAWLERAWAFASALPPVFNSLKAHLLHQRLLHDEMAGKLDEARFLEYVKLPRPVRTTLQKYQENGTAFRHPVNLAADFNSCTRFPSIGDDEPLLRRSLLAILATKDDAKAYAPYLEEWFLKSLLAEAKLTAGVGPAEKWFAMLTPEQVQALKERVDLEFAPANQTLFGIDDEVKLSVFVKNAAELRVNVFEINTENHSRQSEEPINTDVDLDGLVASVQQKHSYAEPPLRRVGRDFTFPELKGKRGVWVIDFIGNGRSSRALIRKGQLHTTTLPVPGGTLVTVLDEKHQPMPKSAILLGTRRLAANDKGHVLLPLHDGSAQEGQQSVILLDGAGFAQRANIYRQQEGYQLRANFTVPHESLLAGRNAQLAVNASLMAEPGFPVPVAELDSPRITITSTNLEGQNSVKTIEKPPLKDGELATIPFLVPDRLAMLKFEITGRVKSRITGAWLPVAATDTIDVNVSTAQNYTRDTYLSQVQGQFTLRVLGKNGEPSTQTPVHIGFYHRHHSRPIYITLGTDANGQVALGTLNGIAKVESSTPGEPRRFFDLPAPDAALPQQIHLTEGEKVVLPWLEPSLQASRENSRLLAIQADSPVADFSEELKLEGGYLSAEGLPAGDYELSYGEAAPQKITIRIAKGVTQDGFVHGPARVLELRDYTGLQLAAVEKGDAELSLRLTGATKAARVHVVATRFLPQAGVVGDFAFPPDLQPTTGTPGLPTSAFVSGRLLGEEYRYVLERQSMAKYPSLLLAKPSLLLNPWAIRDTSMSVQEAQAGNQFGLAAAPKPASSAQPAPAAAATMERKLAAKAKQESGPSQATWPNQVQFLADQALAIYNLVPDAEGVVKIPLKDLAGRPHLRISACDVGGAIQTQVSLAETPAQMQDLTLTKALDPAGHFTRQNEVTVLEKEKPFTLKDGARAEFIVQGSLGDVVKLFEAKGGGGGKLEAFRWLLDWPTLDEATRLQRFSENACHELHFFLLKKDPKFFDAVVKPFLANKHHKTFLDHYLLGSDLRPWLDAWKYQRLNVVERILLAQRLPEEAARTQRELRSLAELSKPSPVELEREFEIGLASLGLEKGRKLAETMAVDGTMQLQQGESAGAMGGGEGGAIGKGKGGVSGAGVVAARRLGGALAADESMKQMSAVSGDMAKDAAATVSNPESLNRFAKIQGVEKSGKLERGTASLRHRGNFSDKLSELSDAPAMWRPEDTTKEWAENNYHNLRQAAQGGDLVTANDFWTDYALWDGKSPFLSKHINVACRNFTEAVLALAVLDLPFPSAATEPKYEMKDGGLVITPTQSCLLYHREIKPAEVDANAAKLLVSQNFYRMGERKLSVNGVEEDKFLREEFLTGVIYGCEIVVTNPTSKQQTVNLLAQIPQGAVPMTTSRTMNSLPVNAEPYRTTTLDYFFYFPKAGTFPHLPVQVGAQDKAIATAEPFTFNVVEKSTKFDTTSWEYVSQRGTLDQVLDFLRKNNAHRLDLSLVAWRCQEKDGYAKLIALLTELRIYQPQIWAYSLKHGDATSLRQWLLHQDGWLQGLGPAMESPLVTVEPVERVSYEHLEYSPLINARAHTLGRTRTILNPVFHQQYHAFLDVLAHGKGLTPKQRLEAAQYLLTQDRVEEAAAMAAAAAQGPQGLEEKLQLDYLHACLAMLQEKPADARQLAAAHLKHPVLRWREKFTNLVAQLDELEGKAPAGVDKTADPNRTAEQNALASKEPTLELAIEDREVRVAYRNLEEITVRYYPMDLEFLFSSAPFVSSDTRRFSLVQPAKTETLKLPAGAAKHNFALPKEFDAKNVLVEIQGNGKTASQTYYANELDVAISENYGQLQVRHKGDHRPLAKTYVKVFAEINGQAKFYKDGYTDLRGKFDYASLSTDQIGQATRFSILVLSEPHGATVREAKPPQR